MSETKQASPLFGLPLELREEIYKSVLSDPSQGLDILRTCHEIRHEAQKFLYQRKLIFPSQGALYTWLAKTPRELLAYDSSIAIHIQDVDLRPILGDLTASYQSATPLHFPTSELYRAEVVTLGRALKELPKLRIITLRALLHQPSTLYRHYTTQILRVLSASCPRLLDLRLEGNFHHQGLDFLMTLNDRLESFSFNGFSLSSPGDTIKILASLGHLRNLSLVSEHAPSKPEIGLHGNLTLKVGPSTEQDLRTARRLPYLSTAGEIPVLSPTSFFISEVLGSLHNHKALRCISLQLSYAPDFATLVSLGGFLKRSTITQLELDWPDLQPDVLELCLLGSYVKTVCVRTNHEAYAFDILRSIVESRQAGDLNNLRKVVLVRPKTFHGDVRSLRSDVKTTSLGVYNVSLLRGCATLATTYPLADTDRKALLRAKRTTRTFCKLSGVCKISE
jgi:hypothetical protein